MGAKKNVGFPSESYQRIKSGEEIFQEMKEKSAEERVEEISKTPRRKFGGVERLKTAGTRGLRSAPRSPTAAYLDLYMLLKKKQVWERHSLHASGREEGFKEQLREAVEDVRSLEESMPELKELREGKEKETEQKKLTKWKKRKDWKVVDLEY